MCDFVCGIMSHAKSSLHWSVIHYQMTFEGHSGVVLKCLLLKQTLISPA